MILNKKLVLALRLLGALVTAGGKIKLADIAEKIGSCVSNLETLAAKLKKAGLIAGTRGPGGGYEFGSDVAWELISLEQIAEAVLGKQTEPEDIAIAAELSLINLGDFLSLVGPK